MRLVTSPAGASFPKREVFSAEKGVTAYQYWRAAVNHCVVIKVAEMTSIVARLVARLSHKCCNAAYSFLKIREHGATVILDEFDVRELDKNPRDDEPQHG